MVLCLGELTVDFISTERVDDIARAATFHRRMGGSPACVAAGLRAAGVPAALVSRVGADEFGVFARSELETFGVSIRHVAVDLGRPTRCVFIAYDAAGRRKIAIANRRSEDQALSQADITPDLFDGVRLVHVGGTALLGERNADAVRAILDEAVRRGLPCSFDPNIRLDTASPDVLDRIRRVLGRAEIVKLDGREYEALRRTGLLNAFRGGVLLRTDGVRGAWIHAPAVVEHIPAERVACIDPTGAGDAFLAGFLAAWLRLDAGRAFDPDALSACGRAAAHQAAMAVRWIGAAAYAGVEIR